MHKIIDFHTHPFLNDASNICIYKEAVPMKWEDIYPTYAALGVEMICGSVIIFGNKEEPAPSQLDRILQCNQIALQLRELLGAFYYPGLHIHPAYIPESVAEIQRFAEKGFCLVGELVPYTHGWNGYSKKEFSYLLDVCQEYNMVVNMHSMDDDDMDRMVSDHKNLKIVMAHPGERDKFLRHLKRMDMSENYYLDLSGTGIFRHATLARGIAEHGAERFIFGSDYPICNPGMFVGAVTLDDLISEEDKEKVLYTNAKKLLGL